MPAGHDDSPHGEEARLARRDAVRIALVTLLGLLLLHDLRLSTVDDVDRYHLTEGMARFGRPVEPPWHGVPGRTPEQRVSRYYLFPSALAVPFYLAATPFAPPWHGWDPRTPSYATGAAVDLTNAFVLPALAAAFFLAARGAGAPRAGALAVSALLPWATFLGAEAKDFGAEPFAALAVVLSLHAARRARRKSRGGVREAFLAGVAASLAPLARVESVLLIPGPLWLSIGRTPGGGRRTAAFLVGAAPGLLLVVGYTLWRFGIIASGYGAHGQGLSLAGVPAGLIGLLVSPGRSLFVYAPTTIFALWLVRRSWNDLPSLARASVLMAAVDLVVHAGWPVWSGGYVWGPRYAFLAVVLVHLVAPFGLEGPLRRRGFAALAALGVAVNLPGLLADPAAYLEVLHRAFPPWGEDRAWWDPLYHPWFGHVALLLRGRHDLWILRAMGV